MQCPVIRWLSWTAGLLVLVLAFASDAPAARKKTKPIVNASAAPADPRFAPFEKLLAEGKLAEAASEARRLRESAVAAKDDTLWQRALVAEVRSREGLGETTEALRLLREEPWPGTKEATLELGLLYVSTLRSYLQRYRWEIRQRERIESKERLPVEKMSAEQLFQELADVLDKLWAQRATWGTDSNETLPTFVRRNDFPAEVRGTVRDTVTYLAAQALGDTSFWSPAESNETTQLDVASLLEGVAPEKVSVADGSVHPLVRVSVVLRDLETWHRAAGRLDAALEAKLERYRRVRAAVAEADRQVVSDALEKRLVAFRKAEWWAVGMTELATYRREEGRLREAHRLASLAQEEYPDSPGGRRAAHLLTLLEAPSFRLEAMRVDGAKRRSLLVHRRNVKTLYFRAYALGTKFLEERRGNRWEIFPDRYAVPALLKKPPVAEWREEFVEARDFGEHRSYVTPPMEAPGIYLILASLNPKPDKAPNITLGTVFQIADHVLLREDGKEGSVTFTVVRGATGEPIAGARVDVYSFSPRKPFQRLTRLVTDAEGRATYATTANRDALFAVAEVKDDKGVVQTVVDSELFALYRQTSPKVVHHGFLYTDRAIYRPKQTLQWKLVLVRAKAGSAELSAASDRSTTVELLDANGDIVASQQGRTDAYGTLAGKFEIPSGKLLGTWTLRTRDGSGHAEVKVEEYKRPTFAVVLEGAKEAVKLNSPAVVEGEARYYFGMAVPEGQVRWRVVREPVAPPWWGWCGFRFWGEREPAQGQTIAAGTTRVDERGRFRLSFLPKADERLQFGEEASYVFRVAVDVTDPGGETRSVSREYRLGPASVVIHVELSAPFFDVARGGTLTFRRTNLDGEPRRGKGTWRILSLTAAGGPVLPADEKPSPRGDLPKLPEVLREDTLDGDSVAPRWSRYVGWEASLAKLVDGPEVFRGSLEHGEDGVGVANLPKLEPGAYRVRYDGEDDFGKKVRTWRDILVVGGPIAPPVPGVLEVDRTHAEPGDKVTVLAASGFLGQTMTYEIVRDGVVVRRERLSGGDSTLREITVTEADRGGFSLVLTFVRDYQLVRIHRDVHVPWTNYALGVTFESFRDKLRPGSSETWTLRVKTPKSGGKDAALAAAQVLAFMYDRSLDAFAPHVLPTPNVLLPTRTGAPMLDAPLTKTGAWYFRDDTIVPLPEFPSFRPDQFETDAYMGYASGPGGVAFAPSMPRMQAAPAPMKSKARKGSVEADGEEAGEPSANAAAQEAPGQESDGKADVTATASGVRSQFAETAFWFPQLLTGPDGSVRLTFTVPDSVTSWRVSAHALTKDVKYGEAEHTVRTVKELMVRPYVPRFVREGDALSLRVAINNAGERPLEGKVRLDLIDPDTQKSVAADFELRNGTQSFAVAPGKGIEVRYSMQVPKRPGPLAVRVVATAGDLTDGELRPMPILPSRLHLTQSRFATLRDREKRVLRFDDLATTDDRTRVDERLVMTLDAQLLNGVLRALPYLARYPYECIEQTLNRFLSTSLVGAVLEKHPTLARLAREAAKRGTPYVPWEREDPNRKLMLEETPWLETSRGGKTTDAESWANVLDPSSVRRERDDALTKLSKLQRADGGFPWFPGGPSSPYITLYVLNGFARAVESGISVPKDSVRRAWAYLADTVRRRILPALRKDRSGPDEFAAFLVFVATSFPDGSWTEGGLTEAELNELVEIVFADWRRHSRYGKAYLAWTLKRLDRLADARLVLASVLDAAKSDRDRGVYWAPEERSWLWYNDTVESHAFILRTALEVDPKHPKVDGLALWLFLNRKLNHWKSTRATAEAIYSLLKFVSLDRTLGTVERYVVESGDWRQEFAVAPDAKTTTARFVLPGSKIDPRKNATVTFESKSRAFALASATWHFSTDRLPRESSSDIFAVNRAYFVRETTPAGTVLRPLADGARIRVGDEVEVQLSLKTKHEAEYLHLRDPRGAGFEPEGAVSGHRWALGYGWYEEFRDSATNFFFERLPAGEYAFRYRVRAATEGKFRVGPATIQSMYAPEFTAYSSGTSLSVKD
jgi:uncharacterized protein YfaS (alpha-2-macroglobulin family)